jgi:hypothetical protein
MMLGVSSRVNLEGQNEKLRQRERLLEVTWRHKMRSIYITEYLLGGSEETQ